VITVNGDIIPEANETLFVTLSNPVHALIGDGQGVGTIIDDEGPTGIAVGNAVATEGNTGTTSLTFEVTLAVASTLPITVDYATSNGTAAAGLDYLPASGTLSFAPGQTLHEVNVSVLGDLIDEPDQTVFLLLSNASANAFISTSTGTGTITDDDPNLDANQIDYCTIMDPPGFTVRTGAASPTISCQVFEAGLTPTHGVGMTVHVGWGPRNADPWQAGWTWFVAPFAFTNGFVGDDVFQGGFGSPDPGQYAYACRVSLDEGNSWSYCDGNGAGTDPGFRFSGEDLPVMTVAP
jgi:hypothetical protein